MDLVRHLGEHSAGGDDQVLGRYRQGEAPAGMAGLGQVEGGGGCLGLGDMRHWPEMIEFSGKAMGLPLAVGSHDVTVASEPGAGSSFSFTLKKS